MSFNVAMCIFIKLITMSGTIQIKMLEFAFNRKFSILKNLKKKKASLINALKRILLIFTVFDSEFSFFPLLPVGFS